MIVLKEMPIQGRWRVQESPLAEIYLRLVNNTFAMWPGDLATEIENEIFLHCLWLPRQVKAHVQVVVAILDTIEVLDNIVGGAQLWFPNLHIWFVPLAPVSIYLQICHSFLIVRTNLVIPVGTSDQLQNPKFCPGLPGPSNPPAYNAKHKDVYLARMDASMHIFPKSGKELWTFCPRTVLTENTSCCNGFTAVTPSLWRRLYQIIFWGGGGMGAIFNNMIIYKRG